MLIARRHNLLAALCGTFFACLSASAAQQQEEAAIGGEENGLPEVGEPFRDCPECPLMVVVPSGTFRMGALESEKGSYDDERPVHTVSVPSFAMGVHEVTFTQWDACVANGGCGGYRPDDEGRGRGRHPVVNVSWRDAQLYLGWLTYCTGERYRLPTEAEWEYAARAGTATPFHTGGTISTDQANYGNYTYSDGARGEYRGRTTVAVGSFPANGFGLHDVHGNVWEWVQDCWEGNYKGARGNGSALEREVCFSRVLRGGSWISKPGFLRSANRYRDHPWLRWYYLGFRVARTLTP